MKRKRSGGSRGERDPPWWRAGGPDLEVRAGKSAGNLSLDYKVKRSAGKYQVEEFRAAGDAELGVHLRQVLLDGLLAVAHHRADLGRGEPLEHQARHFLFFLGQPRARERLVHQPGEVDV